MRGSLLLSLFLAGCGAHGLRTEQVGTGHGLVTSRTATAASEISAAPGGGGMALPRGTYDFELRIGVPRAQLVDWKVACTGVEERTGQVGQAFDEYKEQRLAQLTREREQQAAIQARVLAAPPPPTGVVVVARPPVARVVTPAGQVVVRPAPVVVEPQAAPAVEVEAAPIAPITELPPGDLGQGTFPARVRVVLPADGACAITAVADDPNVSAFFSVTRERNLGVEAAERKQQLYVGAVGVRGRMTERLVAFGADPQAKQRRLEADARARAEAEAARGAELARRRQAELAVSLEVRAKADAEATARRQREAARREREAALAWEAGAPARARAELARRQLELSLRWRTTLTAWLVATCGADPHRRDRIAQAKAERELALRYERERSRELELRLRLQREEEERARRDAARAERENREAIERARRERAARELAELAQRRTGAAIRIRTSVVESLVAFGAKLRPPMPAPQVEEPGPAPFDGAVWAAGRWEWNAIQVAWQWRGGGWRDTTRFGGSGGEVAVRRTVVVEPPPAVVVEPPVGATVVTTPVAVPNAGVVIEVGARPRPTYAPARPYRPRPAAPYKPRPSENTEKTEKAEKRDRRERR